MIVLFEAKTENSEEMFNLDHMLDIMLLWFNI